MEDSGLFETIIVKINVSYSIMKSKIILLLILFCLAQAEIIAFDKEVLSKIYEENKVCLVYVHGDTHNFEVESIFNSQCYGDKMCAILDPNNLDYNELLQFIGYEDQQFFIIFDPASQRKYIHKITPSFNENDLLSFQYKFTYKELQPYFSSEPLPTETDLRCSKLVGKNLGEFLRRKERVKVVLLYHLNSHCANCDQILLNFIPFAQNYYEESKVTFGYFNTFLNDSPVIPNEKVPTFLIFLDAQYDHPFQIDSPHLDQLSYFLSKTLDKSMGQRAEAIREEEKEEKPEQL